MAPAELSSPGLMMMFRSRPSDQRHSLANQNLEMATYTTSSAKPFPLQDIEAESATDPSAISAARVVLIAVLVTAPWAFGAVEPWAWMGLGLAASVVLFLWGWGGIQQKLVRLTWSPLYVPLGLFFLLGIAQYLLGRALDRSQTQQALVLLAADLTLFFVSLQLFSRASRANWHAFGVAVVLLAGSLGLFATLQFAAGEPRIYGEVATPSNMLFGPYVNPNHFAGLMEMLIPVAVLYIAERYGKRSWSLLAWLAVGAILAIASLLLSGSRGGLLALIAEAVIAIAVLRSRSGRLRRRSLAMIVAGMVIGAVLLFTWVDPGIVARKLALIANPTGEPAWLEWASFRKVVAFDALHIVRDYPLAGVGLGNFETAYPRYQSFPSDLWIDYAHNDYVQAIADTGLLGAVLIAFALVLFVPLAFGNKSLGAATDGRWIQLGAALGCCGMLVHSFFDFNLHIPANAAWFAVLAGVATANLQGRDDRDAGQRGKVVTLYR